MGCAFGAEQKRAACGSFSLRGNPYCRMEIRLQGFPRNLHPNPQPSAKRDIAALNGRVRAVPSAQSKKEPQRGSFSLHGNPYCRMEIRLQGFPRNLHPNPQPSAKRGHGSAETGRAVPSAQTEKEPLAALFLCAGTRRIRGGTPHPPRQARHLPPLGKAKDYFCFHIVCKVSVISKACRNRILTI